MPQSQKAITNFTSGEFDPKLYGREDIEQYNNGAKELTNCIVEWYGGVTGTPGTYFVEEQKDVGVIVSGSIPFAGLIPFEFSTEQAYIIEAGHEYMRFFKDNGIILDGASAYEISTTYDEADINKLRVAQTADTMYIVHGDYVPRVLTRSGHTSWSLADFDYKKGPLLNINTTSTTITPSAATGTGITLTASTAIFDEKHIGSIWKVNNGWVRIKTVTSGGLKTTCTADVLYGVSIGGTSAYVDWHEAAWSHYRGYPQYVTFYEQRLVFLSTDNQPNGVWLSKSGGEISDLDKGSGDDADAITALISSTKMNKIQWGVPSGDYLAIGNAAGINRLWSGSSNLPITPDNANAKPILFTGAADVEPIQVGGLTHYVQRGDEVLRTIIYNFSSDAYDDGDLTKLSRHITESGIKKMVYQQSPHSVIWCLLNNGEIATCTVDIMEKITAWSRQTTDGKFIDIAVIPNGTEDQVWCIVERTIGLGTKRYIEYFMPFNFGDKEDAFFVHSGLTYSGTATSSIVGLDHLEGKTVTVLADSFPHPNCLVANGAISLVRDSSIVHAGLFRQVAIETLPLERGSAIGSSQGKFKKILRLFIKLFKTVGCDISYGSNKFPLKFKRPYDLFSGNVEIVPPHGWDKNVTVRIEQNLPLPITVTGIYPHMDTND